MSTVDGPPARAARTNGRSSRPRSLFISGRDDLGAGGVGQLVVPGPEPGQDVVVDVWRVARCRNAGTVSSLGRSARVGVPGWARRVRQAGAEDVVGAWSPAGGVDVGEDETRLSTVRAVSSPSSGLSTGGRARLSASKSTTRSPRRAGSRIEDVGDEVAFGVDHDQAAAGFGVGEDHAGHQFGLAGAGGAEDVQVVAGVGDPEPDRRGWPASVTPIGLTSGAVGRRCRVVAGRLWRRRVAGRGWRRRSGTCASAASSVTDSRSPVAAGARPRAGAGGGGGGGGSSCVR